MWFIRYVNISNPVNVIPKLPLNLVNVIPKFSFIEVGNIFKNLK